MGSAFSLGNRPHDASRMAVPESERCRRKRGPETFRTPKECDGQRASDDARIERPTFRINNIELLNEAFLDLQLATCNRVDIYIQSFNESMLHG